MEEHITEMDSAEEQSAQPTKRSRYGIWIRVTALIVVIAIVLNFLTGIDFSLMRYQGTDQMVAAQYLMSSTAYLGANRLQRLKSLLTSVDSFSINLQAAEIAIAKMDYRRAAEFLSKSIPRCQDSLQTAELYNRLGCVYMLENDAVQARQAFEESIRLNPEEPAPYLLRAQLRYQDSDLAGAAEDARAYLKLGGNEAEMLPTVASICELDGDLKSAIEAMSRMLVEATVDHEKAQAYAERGRLQYLLGLDEEAARDIVEAKILDKTVLTGVHYAIIGLHEYNKGNYAKSREDFLKAARLSEDGNAEYYEQAILCGYLSDDMDFMQQAIAEAEEKGMMTASSLLIEGILLFSQEKYEEADAALTRSVATGKIVPGVYYYRGLTRMTSERYEEAVADFTEALNWEDNEIGCIFNRGVCYFAMEDDDNAKADLTYVINDGTDESLAASAEELLNTIEAINSQGETTP